MRSKPNKDVVEARVLKHLNKIHAPAISLIQALHDMIPEGSVLGSKVEFTKVDGHVRVGYGHKPVTLVINDGIRIMSIEVSEAGDKSKI